MYCDLEYLHREKSDVGGYRTLFCSQLVLLPIRHLLPYQVFANVYCIIPKFSVSEGEMEQARQVLRKYEALNWEHIDVLP